MIMGLLAIAAAVLLWVGLRRGRTPKSDDKAPETPRRSICDQPPPSKQPNIPAGWKAYHGTVSATAEARAVSMLELELGAFQEFADDDGRELGVMVTWHCDEARGWHKGANLFERQA